MRPLPLANPPNPWSSTDVEWIGPPPEAHLHVYEERAKTILSENDSPDLRMRWSVNPYRGCFHGCAYCYARPSHQYWGFGAGTDFERRLIAKVNAPELLRDAFYKKSWKGEVIVFSGNTDCYQPLEASYGLTRRCLEVCLEFRNPAHVITKGALIRRDLALVAALAKQARFSATLSIPFADDEMGRAIEPFASACSARFETVRMLVDAGVEVGVNIAPVIPGLNDTQVPEILERAHAAGARRAALLPVRLPLDVLPVFIERLDAAFPPERALKVKHAIEEMRGGKMNVSEFGARMRGEGPRWKVLEQLFESNCRRLGINRGEGSAGRRANGGREGREDEDVAEKVPTTFRRPTAQTSMFE